MDPLFNEPMMFYESDAIGNSGVVTPSTSGVAKYDFAIKSGTPPLSYLYEGTYELWFYSAELAKCEAGLSGNDLKDMLRGCTGGLYGSVVFDLDNNGYQNGTPKITVTDLNSEQEKESPGSGLPITDLTPDKGIDISLGIWTSNIFQEALKSATKSILGMIHFGIVTTSTWINNSLINGNDLEDALGASDVWKQTRNMALGLLTFAIILIAFANILSLDLGNYGLARILPKMIIAIVMTYFSYLIAVFLLDLMSAFQSLLFQASSTSGFTLASSAGTVLQPSVVDNVNETFQVIFLVLIGAGLFIAVLWLWLILIVRTAMLFILIAIAPIAFMANILPFTETYYKKWWAEFWKWAFMGPAIAFMLWLSQSFLGGYGSSFGAASGTESWALLITAAVLIFMAATLPLKMGGEIMKKATQPVTGAGKWGYKQTGVPAFLEQRKAAGNRIPARRGQKMWASMAQVPGLRRVVAGTDKRGAEEARATLKADFAKSFVKMTKEELNTALDTGKFKGIEQEAAVDYLAGNGQLDLDKANVAKLTAERLVTDGGFMNTFKDKQVDGFSKLTTNASTLGLSPDAKKLVRGEADKSIAGKAGFELKPAQIEHLAKNNPEYLEQLLGDEDYMKAIVEKGGPGAKAAWGEAIKHYAQQNGHAPRAKGPEHEEYLKKLAEVATTTELRARELAGKPIEQGGKGLDEHGRPKNYEGKNAWGEGGKEDWVPRGNPYQPQGPQRPNP